MLKENEVDINDKLPSGSTLLEYAVSCGQTRAIDNLLYFGVDSRSFEEEMIRSVQGRSSNGVQGLINSGFEMNKVFELKFLKEASKVGDGQVFSALIYSCVEPKGEIK